MTINSRVKFLNQPKDLVEPERTQRRLEMIGLIENYLNGHSIFGDDTISVTFFDTGVSGLTSLIETSNKKYILKNHLYSDSPKGEAHFLQAWETLEILVPHVFESGLMDHCYYILMEYIPAKTFEYEPEIELLNRKVFRQMGASLRKMHSIPGKGYGLITDEGAGKYDNLATWISENPQTRNQLAYMQEHNILPFELFGSIEQVIDILTKHSQDNPQSVYCHWDFAPGNILNTEPITIFDPIPMFNITYLDIARSIMQTVAQNFNSLETRQQFLDGYFPEGTLNEKVLHAALVFICHTKMPYWHRTGQEGIIDVLKTYLNKYKVSLD